MTLPVVDSWDVRGVAGPKYKVGPTCSNPSCKRWAEHAHHLVRRSAIGGDHAWVAIDGKTYPNLTGLCAECHDMVTGRIGGHKAAIRLNVDEGIFYWSDIITAPGANWVSFVPLGPLDPQPPAPDSLAPRASNEEEPESCPVCGQVKARRRTEPTGTVRRRKSWGVDCPDDGEDGAGVLDTLVDEIAPHLHLKPGKNGSYTRATRYFVVVPSLVYVHQNIGAFLDSLRGVGA